jgi:hypothetical protein
MKKIKTTIKSTLLIAKILIAVLRGKMAVITRRYNVLPTKHNP